MAIDVVERHKSSNRDYYISLPKQGGHLELFQLTPSLLRGLKESSLRNDESLRGAASLSRDQLTALAALA